MSAKQGASAVTITIEEMDKLIRRSFRAFHPRKEKSNWGEVLYILTPDDEDPDSIIRVQTSIFEGRQHAQRTGEDSIKVVLFNTRTKRPIAEKQQRVHRTEGWKDNLRDRIETAIELFEDKAEERERQKQMGTAREEQKRLKEESPDVFDDQREGQIAMLKAVEGEHPAFSDMLRQMYRFKDKLLSEKQLKWVESIYRRSGGGRRYASECCGGTGVRPDGQPCQCGGGCKAVSDEEYASVFAELESYESVFADESGTV